MPPRRKRRAAWNPTLSRGIIAIVLVVFAAIITLSFFDKAGAVGIVLNDWILSFLFGSIRYTAPVIIVILAGFLIKDIEYNYRPTHVIGALLFFVATSSLIHIKFLPFIMWHQALSGHGGGVFGMLAWPMRTYLGPIGGRVILIGLIAISIFLIFNTSITHIIMLHKKLFAGLGWAGMYFFNTIKTLFVKNGFRIKGSRAQYEDGDDYEDDEDDEEPTKKRHFFSRQLNNSNDEDEDDENYDEEAEDEKEYEERKIPATKKQGATPAATGPWAMKVPIKPLPKTILLSSKKGKPTSGDIKAIAEIIQHTFADFGIDVSMGDVRVGPTVTQYSLKPSKGIKLSRITTLSNDLALALAAHPIRIEAPIPGKSLVGIEVPNQKTALVTLKELLENKTYRRRDHNMMIGLGKDVAGKVWFADLPKMPHLLIAGATGSGKTVCINTVIMSLLFQNTPETLRMIMVDPKRVELTLYNGIPHLLTPVVTNVKKTVNALKWTVGEMDRRFDILSQDGSRDINSYNKKHPRGKIPHIVFIIDELADLMAMAANEVEAGIIRLAQMARAVGIHLIIATQRPSVDVITGLMKANIPARIAFSVASLIDSRTILDAPGAEKLLGRGDMLFQTAELSKPVRIQAAFIAENEVNSVVNYLRGDEKIEYDESILEKPTNGNGTMNMFGGGDDGRDPLFNEAKEAILQVGKASASFLQRKLKIGYARAARILDELEEAGIIGPADGAKPREILVTEQEIETGMDMGQECNVFADSDEESGMGEDKIEEDEEEYEDDDGEEYEEVDEDDEDEEGEELDEGEDEEYEDVPSEALAQEGDDEYEDELDEDDGEDEEEDEKY